MKAAVGGRPEPSVTRISLIHRRIELVRRVSRWYLRPSHKNANEKKAGVVEDPQVLDHTGLLFDRPPGISGLSFV
jgi:hypothetical protein